MAPTRIMRSVSLALAVLCPAVASSASSPNVQRPIPGPSLVIRVPVRLHNVPVQIDTYEVRCSGGVVTKNGKQSLVSNTASNTVIGAVTGTSGVAGKVAANQVGIDFSADVDVALDFKLIKDQYDGKPDFQYSCTLFLRGTVRGITTTYLADAGLKYPLTPGKSALESGFPIAPTPASVRWTDYQTVPPPTP